LPTFSTSSQTLNLKKNNKKKKKRRDAWLIKALLARRATMITSSCPMKAWEEHQMQVRVASPTGAQHQALHLLDQRRKLCWTIPISSKLGARTKTMS